MSKQINNLTIKNTAKGKVQIFAPSKGMVIHHKDFNRGNWNLENLELLTRAEHLEKHKINRWNNDIIIKSKDREVI